MDQERTDNPEAAPASGNALPPKPRLRRWEASRHLRDRHGLEIAVATLAKLACIGGGPPFQKAGRTPLYPVELLDVWATRRLGRIMHSTSEDGRA